MLRRNLFGIFYFLVALVLFIVVVATVFRYFDASSDWEQGPGLSTNTYWIVVGCSSLMAALLAVISIQGQFFTKARKYSGFAIVLLFFAWFGVGFMFIDLFIDRLSDANTTFGPWQQVILMGLFAVVLTLVHLYTLIKFPEESYLDYVKEKIGEEVDRAIHKPDLSCGQCGTGLRENWEYCPGCGGLVVTDDVLHVVPISVEDQTPKKRKGLFGKKGKTAKKKPMFEMDEEPELDKEPEDEKPSDDDFVDDLVQKEVKKDVQPLAKGFTRTKCDKCGTLLEIRNPNRPLNVRCPTCENIWLLEE